MTRRVVRGGARTADSRPIGSGWLGAQGSSPESPTDGQTAPGSTTEPRRLWVQRGPDGWWYLGFKGERWLTRCLTWQSAYSLASCYAVRAVPVVLYGPWRPPGPVDGFQSDGIRYDD